MAQSSLKCKRCGKGFATDRSTKVYCSERCRKNAWKDRNRVTVRRKSREYWKKKSTTMTAEEREEFNSKYRKPKEEFPCLYCGKTIVGFKSKKKYCSMRCCRKQWRKLNPDKARFEVKQRKHTLRATSDGSFTYEAWQKLKKDCNYSCPMCHRPEPEIKLTIDHIKPISKGGLHILINIQPLCVPCNGSKNDSYEEDSEQCVTSK